MFLKKKETLENQSSKDSVSGVVYYFPQIGQSLEMRHIRQRHPILGTTAYNRTRLVIYKCFQNEYSVVVFLWERGGSYKTQNEGHMMTRQSNVRVKRPLDETI